MPHSADVIVKPPTATMMKRRLPKRDAIQPTGAVMIADAMMYDVSTHVIWSRDAERLPCMCGNATLAIVWSSVCMNIAAIAHATARLRAMVDEYRGPCAGIVASIE